jgi:hypothetical protein
MLGDRLLRVCHHALIVIFVVASMIALSAQTVVDPRYVEFNPSPDHNTLASDGSPLVSRYWLSLYPAGSTTAFATVDMGKPAPGTGGIIRVDFLPLLTTAPTSGVTYDARVTAVGPGGATASSPSNTFSFSAPACTYAISPTSRSLTASAATGSVSVTAGTGCAWSAASSATWITLTGATSGTSNGTVPYSVAANSSTAQRTGTLTIAGQTFTVTQAGAACTYAITPTSRSLTASTATGSVSVTAGTGCAWSAASSATWITLTGATSGTSSGSVPYSVAANTGTAQRTGTLTIAGQTFTVTQAGAACTYAITPTSRSLTASAATGSVSVTAGTGCAWSAASSATWITLTGATSGTSNGSVPYSVAANSSTAQRTGTLTIAGQTFTVTQAGAACTYTITPTSQSATAAASSGSASVSAGTGCEWSATSNATWLTLSGTTTGSGSGTVPFGIEANLGTAERTGTLTIAGQTLTVTQAGAPCSYSITPASQTVAAGGGSGSSSVTTPAGCGWTALSNAAWISLTSAISGSGNGTVTFSIAANGGSTARAGTLTIAGQTFTVSQSGAGCTTGLTPTTRVVSSAGGSHSTTVTAPADCAWGVTNNDPGWITVTSGTSGTGGGVVNFTVAANSTQQPKTGTLTIGGRIFTVSQAAAACSYSISPTGVNVPATASTGSTALTTTATCSWTATSNTAWITVTDGSSKTGSGVVNFSVAANPTSLRRFGSLTIGGRTFSVTQSSNSCAYTLSPTSRTMAPAGGSASVTVATPSTCAWIGTPSASWITVANSGMGNGTLNYTVSANGGSSTRTGTITVGGQVHTITQSAGTAPAAPSNLRAIVATGSPRK